MTDLKAVHPAYDFLHQYGTKPVCVKPALSLLSFLLERDSNLEAAEELCLVAFLLKLLQQLAQHEEVVCLALSVLECCVMDGEF